MYEQVLQSTLVLVLLKGLPSLQLSQKQYPQATRNSSLFSKGANLFLSTPLETLTCVTGIVAT
jgi:hypothetical protein